MMNNVDNEMHMILKEDIVEAKERLAAFWEGEKGERPVIGYSYRKPTSIKTPPYDPWMLAEDPDNIENYVSKFENYSQHFYFGAECIPRIDLNYGPGIVAALFGCKPIFNRTHRSATVWFEHPIPTSEIVEILESARLNQNNDWYTRILKVTEYTAQKAEGRYSVNVTDLGGILDILASFLPFKDMVLSMRRKPELIDTCRAIIMEKWHTLYNDITAILDKYNAGCNSWMNIWCPKHWYPIQCDISAALSPKFFKRFVLPDLKEQTEKFDYCVYHMDGPHQIKYIDDLIQLPNLNGIQWVPGENQPEGGDDKWIPMMKKIQSAGKFLQEFSAKNMGKMYRELDPNLLYVESELGTKIWAEFYLPDFMGGMGGIDEYEDG